jgi:hypothetical protein
VLTAEPSSLHSLIDRLVAPEGLPEAAGHPPPVLVTHGADGTPRPDILVGAYERWAGRTPMTMVDPLAVDSADPMRSLVAAVMLGLSSDVPGYRPISFARVVLAHVALTEPIDESHPEQAAAAMRARLDRYRDRTVLRQLVSSLIEATEPAMHTAAAGVRLPAQVTADGFVRRQLGWWTRRRWKEPLAWFAHQDQQPLLPLLDPLSTLVRLSVQAQSRDQAVQAGVGDLLMAALLADLRAGRARTGIRSANPLALIDHGDAPGAAAFTASLLRVRRNLATTARALGIDRPPDPLVLVTTGTAALTATLAVEVPLPEGHERGHLADPAEVPGERPWLAVALDESGAEDVARRARERQWRAPLTPTIVAHSVHRLTDSNRLATDLVLADLEQAPHHIEDFDAVLRRRGPVGDRSLEEYLLDEVVAELSPHGQFDPNLHDNLITLAPARDDDEAGHLVGFLAKPITVNPLALAARARRSPGGAGRRGRLAPLTRFLLLRALAERPDTHPASWHRTFTRLRDGAAARDDTAGRLHHELALGGLDAVADELAKRLDDLPAAYWLVLLDATVAAPQPHRHDPAGDDPEHRSGTEIDALVAALHTLADPSVSSPAGLRRLYRRAERGFRSIVERSPDGHRPGEVRQFVERAERYRALTDALC